MKPAALGTGPMEIAPDEDPRAALADWMSNRDNPFFARTLVNRYWKHFFNRGIVEPEDDMRETNPPSNPELLDALAQNFIASGFDLKALIRDITRSQTYQLSAVPNDYNKADRQNFSRYYPKRLTAEVLFDSLNEVTRTSSTFAGVPAGHAGDAAAGQQLQRRLLLPHRLRPAGIARVPANASAPRKPASPRRCTC